MHKHTGFNEVYDFSADVLRVFGCKLGSNSYSTQQQLETVVVEI